MRYVYTIVLLLALIPAVAEAAAPPDSLATTRTRRVRLDNLDPIEADEVLWLARCIYSESDRPHEQRLVAWVVRNRVETGYRGSDYREVVLEAQQFSAFNTPSARRSHILGLTPTSGPSSWQRALQIAYDVYTADSLDRPFSQTTRHFYSPVSMPGGATPTWAQGVPALSSVALGVDPDRFQFFDSVDSGFTPSPHRALAHVRRPRSAGSGVRARGAVASTRFTGARRPIRLARFSGRVARPARPRIGTPGTPRRF